MTTPELDIKEEFKRIQEVVNNCNSDIKLIKIIDQLKKIK